MSPDQEALRLVKKLGIQDAIIHCKQIIYLSPGYIKARYYNDVLSVITKHESGQP